MLFSVYLVDIVGIKTWKQSIVMHYKCILWKICCHCGRSMWFYVSLFFAFLPFCIQLVSPCAMYDDNTREKKNASNFVIDLTRFGLLNKNKNYSKIKCIFSLNAHFFNYAWFFLLIFNFFVDFQFFSANPYLSIK